MVNPFEDLQPSEVTFARGRLPTRTYVSRSFLLQFGDDTGHPARYVHRVWDETVSDDDDDWEWTTDVVYTTPGGRKQMELQVARSEGTVRKIRIQKVPTSGDATKLEPVAELNREQSARLLDALRALDSIPIEGDSTVRVDDDLLRHVFDDPDAVATAYQRDPSQFRELIESDATASDVIALTRRREVVATMRAWLNEPDTFREAKREAGGEERAWQQLLEANPWVLGVGLSGQLLTSWDENSLEQTVAGRTFQSVGKVADGLMRTEGAIRSLVFAEIKHHQTPLLGKHYRQGCWGPSSELAGAVVQVQQTAHLAARQLGGLDQVQQAAPDGALLPDPVFLLRPRCFVIVGNQADLAGATGGPIPDKVRSFELFRRNLQEPEVLTFDELVARAEWHIELAADGSASN